MVWEVEGLVEAEEEVDDNEKVVKIEEEIKGLVVVLDVMGLRQNEAVVAVAVGGQSIEWRRRKEWSLW